MKWITLLLAVCLSSSVYAKNNWDFCPPECNCRENKIDCTETNYTSVLRHILNYNRTIRVSKLFLDNCKIKNGIPDEFFKRFPTLRHLSLSYNKLSRIPDLTSLRNLDTLVLTGNNIKNIKANSFSSNQRLKKLLLDHNRIELIPSSAIYGLRRLQTLLLGSNRVRKVTRGSFFGLPNLFVLSLDSNRIKKVSKGAFIGLASLSTLKLNSNIIKLIRPSTFKDLKSLRNLHLKDNRLREIPVEAFKDVKQLLKLSLQNNRLKEIPPYAFSGFSLLKSIDIWNRNMITKVAHTAFRDMASLTELKIECNNGAAKLTDFPDLTGTMQLMKLDLTYCNLPKMPENFCTNRTRLVTLNMMWNHFRELPSLKGCKNLKFLDLEHNRIESFEDSLEGLKSLLDLDASHNHIKKIEEKSFAGLRNIDLLDLSHNLIEHVHPKGFQNFQHIKELSLAQNKLRTLPTTGLATLTHINTRGNVDMIEFPDSSHLPSIKKLVLDYPYHCCYYQRKEMSEEDSIVTKNLHAWVFSWAWGNDTDDNTTWPTVDPETEADGMVEPLLLLNDTSITEHGDQHVPHIFNAGDELKKTLLECQPEPNVFYPCDNLMTKDWLRVCVWCVFLLALIGNCIVLFVIFANCAKFDVQRFLTLNLAFADLMLGIYLGFLAVVDIATYGNFRAKALEWQFSSSCQAAGFIAVFASELSVFTLTVITVERFITIKYAMYISKQMTVSKAVFIMIFGWVFCIVLAALPIIRFDTAKGTIYFSDYTKYSVCLPFDIPEKESAAHIPSMIYLSFVLFFNILAFTVIVYCYIKIFLSVRGSGAFNSGDSRVAKRVALLVFTDFACWFPICIFALTAVYGSPIIKDLWLTKVFTVFIFPLNACANPFLYAIFTKQFHNDCWSMCRQMKLSETQFSDRIRRKLNGTSSKFRPSYQAVRKSSTCSFPFGRRSSTKCDEMRVNSRSTYRTPMNTDDERDRDRDELNDRREKVQERETCL